MAEAKRGGIAFHWLMLAGFAIGLGAGLAANLGVSPDSHGCSGCNRTSRAASIRSSGWRGSPT